MSNKSESVKVVVRCRPINSKETGAGHYVIVSMDHKNASVMIKNPAEPENNPPKSFAFDAVFDWTNTQRNLYDVTVFPIVESVLGGYNGTVFAYGQTGTGKTFTMSGVPTDPNLRGVIPNSFQHIFDRITTTTNDHVNYLVRAAFLEIYNEEIRDLLGKDHTQRLELKENPQSGVYVKDLSSFVVNSIPEMEKYMAVGNSNRVVAATNMNDQSSRSHSIFTITVECCETDSAGEQHIRVGKLNLVDLAGSERQGKTGAEGIRLKEGAKINLSLSCLGNVISALVEGKPHIPYRDSKLTRLLQDSLGGNSKTVMIANMGPADYNFEESISTLRYASRAKQIKNKPKINEDPKDAMIREFTEEIRRLKEQLEGRGGVPASMSPGMAMQGLDPELVKQITSQKEEEIMAILAQKGVVEEERQRVYQQLMDIKSKEDNERRERENLAKKLKEMESKILVGGVDLVDKNQVLEQQLRLQAQELETKAQEEARLKRELQLKQEEVSIQEEKYSSIKEEVDVKTKKLKKLWSKIQEAKTEIQDVQEEFQKERTDLLDNIRELSKQLKLMILTVNNFIPPEELARIEKRSAWDEDSGDWKITYVQYAGNNVKKSKDSKKNSDADLEIVDLDDKPGNAEDSYVEAIPNVYFTYTPQDYSAQERPRAKKSGSARPSSAARKGNKSGRSSNDIVMDDFDEEPRSSKTASRKR